MHVSCTVYNIHLTTMHVSGLLCMLHLQQVRSLHSMHVCFMHVLCMSKMHITTMHVTCRKPVHPVDIHVAYNMEHVCMNCHLYYTMSVRRIECGISDYSRSLSNILGSSAMYDMFSISIKTHLTIFPSSTMTTVG